MKSSKFKVQSSKKAQSPSLMLSEATHLPAGAGPSAAPGMTGAERPFELRTLNFDLRHRAFTLVEIMVVVAIIALLLAALLPAFSAVRNQARLAQASAQFKALDTGINAFRAEAALGGALPPSSSDDPQRQSIADPQGEDSNDKKGVAGAHLLVHAMMGADGLGTPGFRDLNNNGRWSDDTYRKFDADPRNCGIYAIDPATGKEKFARYGGAGYVDEKMKENAKTLQELSEKGALLSALDQGAPPIAAGQRVFTDPWDHPILYYKASPTSLRMTGAAGSPVKPGVYWQEDNAVITGTEGGVLPENTGLDFGAGADEHGHHHWIHDAKSPEPSEKVEDVASLQEEYTHTFARFIIDASVKARPTPVQKDSYLLISAGPDAIYGSDDDVLNWTRKTE